MTTAALLAALALVSCGDGTNPFDDPAEESTDPEDDGSLPGTTNPTATSAIQRYEAETESGGGTALSYEYRNDTGQDEFYVDNLPFDADNTYSRGVAMSSIGPSGAYQVYESDPVAVDPVTSNTVGTFSYRAIYGKSTTGKVQFAIVRSGNYVDYGFGGFVYQRNLQADDGSSAGFVLPTCTGACQADFAGDYAGLRVFEGSGGLEYVQGNAVLKVDFEDFNNGKTGAVFYVRNRRVFDINGNDITAGYLAALEGQDTSTTITNSEVLAGNLPNLVSAVNSDAADTNGEVSASVTSYVTDSDGGVTNLDTGNFYAIMSGSGANGEVVGIVVVEQEDPRSSGSVTAQETGGFILYRQ
ncbi:hypothetical protein GCM10011360_22680 [Primorskyibacter flagellatus]|uniref:Uncharacterized protein n=1 Tax=Primorskyibacter flagellatus TaxID=1387277 RepID=A0A917A8K4_9RHOB|nr:hypothetical protein [Primorskyibacter flagellatus]GGE34286.1 hypothetical protein GCM10011360_22680 [Primorskyibacter flagellatus]